MADGNNVSKTWVLGVVIGAFGGLLILMANGAREAFMKMSDQVNIVGLDVSAIKAQLTMQGKALDDAKADTNRQFAAIWARIGTHP